MMLRFTLHNLKRLRSDWAAVFFNIALPVIFYLIFGALQPESDAPLGNGTVAGYVLVGMALYAGVTGAVSSASTAVIEHTTGWGRQLALTPLTPTQLGAARLLVICVNVVLPVTAVYLTGVATGADMPARVWALTYVITVLVALPFGFYGFVWAQLLRSQTAVAVAASSVVLLGFAANVFSPLPETLMQIARFTPMYGPISLARYPLTDGVHAVRYGTGFVEHPLWWAVVATLAWTTIFALGSALLERREKGRS